jgi:4-amino-4-deoxy-L-arabinose transferase-like glycosyltransferase
MLIIILFQLRAHYLLPFPSEGTDQKTMLLAAGNLAKGNFWTQEYLYSPAYTVFLLVLALLSGGNIFIMRIFQILICALIPVAIYKTSRNIGMKFLPSQISALIYCFYVASALISLDFLRAGPLALCFITFAYFCVRYYRKLKLRDAVFAGFFAGLCVLGRENFIPVIFIPIFSLLHKQIRTRIKFRGPAFFVFFAVSPALWLSLFNFYRFNRFGILPGHVSNILSAYHPDKNFNTFNFSLLIQILKNCLVQTANFISPYEWANSLSVYSHSDFSGMLSIMIIPFNVMVIFAVSAIITGRKNTGLCLCAALIVGYVASMSFFPMFYRHRIPVVPLICVTASFGLFKILSLKKISIKIMVFTLIVIFVMITWKDEQKMRPLNEKISTIRYLIEEGMFSKAEKRIKELKSEGVDIK